MKDLASIVVSCVTSIFACVSSNAIAVDGKVMVCHQAGSNAHLLEISTAALAAHAAHGDHIAQFIVDPPDAAVGDGIHFARIGDALAAARAVRIARGELRDASCRISIVVAPGTFRGSLDGHAAVGLEPFPLMVDVPQISLLGGLRMLLDANGRATGESEDAAAVTTLAPDRPLVDAPLAEGLIMVVGHPEGSGGDGTLIEGFSFQSGHALVDNSSGGVGILSLRVDELIVRGNRFEPTLTTAVASVASSARIEYNYARRLGLNCSICLAGPGDYQVSANRLVEGGLGGIYLAAMGNVAFSTGAQPFAPVEPYVFPPSAEVTATVVNNEISGHRRMPVGFGVRTLAVGAGPPGVTQSTHVVLRDNDFLHNTFALIVDGGFPVPNGAVGAIVDVALHGNDFGESCQNDLLVAFTRHTGALGTSTNPYVRNSTYRIALGADLQWDSAWYSHPPGLGNTLVVDDVVVPPGAMVAFDPTRICGS